jgi:integrase
VVYYDAEQIKAMYAAAEDDEERFMMDYFLKSGVRDGEAAHAEYSDVKGGFLNIVDKPHLDWHPKHWHIRRIPIPRDLIAAIERVMKAVPAVPQPQFSLRGREGRRTTSRGQNKWAKRWDWAAA